MVLLTSHTDVPILMIDKAVFGLFAMLVGVIFTFICIFILLYYILLGLYFKVRAGIDRYYAYKYIGMIKHDNAHTP